MKSIINIFFFLSIILTFTKNLVFAEVEEILTYTKNTILAEDEEITISHGNFNNEEKEEIKNPNDDDFYMIFINNTISQDTSTTNGHEKRQDTVDIVVNSAINIIHNLIIDNLDTYQDLSKLEELDQIDSQLKKRDSQDNSSFVNYDSFSYVYPISSTETQTVLYAFLSKTLAKKAKTVNGVHDIRPNHGFKFTSYNERDIEMEGEWNKVDVRIDAPLHLSLISQGKYNEKLIDEYDKTYYSPDTAGEDIDIFIIDSGFNFNHDEFTNTRTRIARCGYNVTEGKVLPMNSQKKCHIQKPLNHGAVVADVAAGARYGVASKANVYGFILNNQRDLKEADILAALQYIKDNLLRSRKAVFNFSFGDYFKMPEDKTTLDYLEKLIIEMSEAGSIFVASAGNESVNSLNLYRRRGFYPCAFSEVICVGAIDNFGADTTENHSYETLHTQDMNSEYYRKANYSNFGNIVDIYAPGFADFYIKDDQDNIIYGIDSGTSVASPIVAGIVATILREHQEIKFTSESMKQYLWKIGEWNIIKKLNIDDNNVFVNNGKRTVYSYNDYYHGCGRYAGNEVCGENQCCSVDGQCSTDMDSCRTDNGCQVNYGLCYLVFSTEIGRCGLGYGACPYGNCCSYDGYCGKTKNYCDDG